MLNRIAVIASVAIAAGLTYASPIAAEFPEDTSVCFQSDAYPGVWLSEYSASGYCTFGGSLDDSDAYALTGVAAAEYSACTDGVPVWITARGDVYGDQNGDGYLAGTECTDR